MAAAIDPAAPRIWWPESGDALRADVVEAGHLEVLVLASPFCRYSIAAAEDIAADPTLALLRSGERTVWLVQPTGLDEVASVREWNRSHPQMPMALISDARVLPGVSRVETPTFVILREGTVLERVQGWPLETGNAPALRAALARAASGDDGI